MEKNASLPFGSFNSLALFTGLCLGASPAAGIAAENSVKNSEETLVVEAAPPSLYSPGASADPKFNKPLVDTTRTIGERSRRNIICQRIRVLIVRCHCEQ